MSRKLSISIVLFIAPFAARAGVRHTAPLCDPSQPIRCHTHLVVDDDGVPIHHDSVTGWGAFDLQLAYMIPPLGSQATIAIVDAYSYANVESDLAVYRAQFGMPPCTRANGCLAIINEFGQTSPLPAASSNPNDAVEEVLDLDMASAACPTCKLVLVEVEDFREGNLLLGQSAALARHPAVISNSWGGPESAWSIAQAEPYFDHPGVATFCSSGDNGFDLAGAGPQYPATSAYVISVGGTALQRAATVRGWSETAWQGAGSSCSNAIGKLGYEVASSCPRRQTTDLSAVALDLAIYVSALGGWVEAYGTSASTPLVAGAFAQLGAGNVRNSDIATIAGTLNDVTVGSNGTCGNSLCDAGTGWDGPTGFGTLNAALLLQGVAGAATYVAIEYPADGQTVPANGFAISGVDVNTSELQLAVDGQMLATANVSPIFSATVHLAAGQHQLTAIATSASGATARSTITIVADGGTGGGSGSGSGSGSSSPGDGSGSGSGSDAGVEMLPAGSGFTTGGCSAGGDGRGLVLLAAAIAAAIRRRALHSRG